MIFSPRKTPPRGLCPRTATVFLDALALTVFDVAHGEYEERWFTLGMDTGGAHRDPARTAVL